MATEIILFWSGLMKRSRNTNSDLHLCKKWYKVCFYFDKLIHTSFQLQRVMTKDKIVVDLLKSTNKNEDFEMKYDRYNLGD